MPYGLRNREVLLANTRQACRSEKTALSLSYSFFFTLIGTTFYQKHQVVVKRVTT